MKKIILIAMLLFAADVFALQKCIVDGKTIYLQGFCPAGTRKPITQGTFSGFDTSGIRQDIVRDNQARIENDQKAAVQAETDRQIAHDQKMEKYARQSATNSGIAAGYAGQSYVNKLFGK
jgi:hypothetical protein